MNHDLINENYKLIAPIASKIHQRLPNVDYDGLCSAGGEGLMQASKSYVSNRDTAFATWANHRIKGSMYDWIRQEYGTRLKRKPVFEQLDVDGHDSLIVKKDKEWHTDPRYYRYNPVTILTKLESWSYIVSRAALPCNRRKHNVGQRLIEAYYASSASMKEIAGDLGLSESRISQLHDYLVTRYAVLLSQGLMQYEVFYG